MIVAWLDSGDFPQEGAQSAFHASNRVTFAIQILEDAFVHLSRKEWNVKDVLQELFRMIHTKDANIAIVTLEDQCLTSAI